MANKDKQLFSGGVPFTGVGDWLDGKIKKRQEIFEKKVVVENGDIDQYIFRKTFFSIRKLFPKIKLILAENIYNSSPSRRNDFDFDNSPLLKKINELPMSVVAIFFASHENFQIFFFRSDTVKNEQFKELLIAFQYVYNLLLIGHKQAEILKIFKKNERSYTPTKSYPSYYYCVHSSIAELVRFKKPEIIFFDSLLPAKELFCLPTYIKMDNLRATYHPVFMKNNVDFECISINKKKLINFKNAKKHYNIRASKEPLILVGSPLYLNALDNSRKYYINGQRFGNLHASNFSGTFDQPILHESTGFYFGKMNHKELWNYWALEESEFGEKKAVFSVDSKYEYLEISKIVAHEPLMLVRALKENVELFFKNKTEVFKKNKKEITLLIGKAALDDFIKEILQNGKKIPNSISDITIVDTLFRLRKTAFFLKDLLEEISIYYDFSVSVKAVISIIAKYSEIITLLVDEMQKKEVDYKFLGVVAPDGELHKRKFLSKVNKNKILKAMIVIKKENNYVFGLLKKQIGFIEKKLPEYKTC